MIVPMLKYSFLVYHAEYPEFLQQIKELGVVHIVKKKDELTPEIVELYRKNSDVARVLKMLANRKVETEVISKHSFAGAEPLLNRVKEIETELEISQQALVQLDKEVKAAGPWGYFSYELIKKLETEGLNIRFLVCPVKKYQTQWEVEHCIEAITDIGSYRYFIKIEKEGEVTQSVAMAGVDEIKLPEKPLSTLLENQSGIKSRIAQLNNELAGISVDGINLLNSYSNKLKSEIGDADAMHQTTREVDGAVFIVEGWVPESKTGELERLLGQTGIYYLKAKSKSGDQPPILLKNNRFTRLFEMISKLYSLPNYGELDLTPFLAPFYLLFFGFCFSDAGYGLLFVAAGTWFKMNKTGSSPILSLIQLLGASTMFFGLLGGTFFGIELYKTSLPFYSNIAQMYGSTENPIDKIIQDIMFKASLGLGLIQILFGMILRAYKITLQKGFKYAVSTISWVALILVSAINYYISDKGIVEFANYPFIITSIACGVGIFFLNTPGKNILINFGSGLWDAYNTVVGGVGDLLSYVRLFALGLASAILGLVFNNLALKLVNPDANLLIQGVGILLMLFVLLAGHAINIFMSGLGSMVHPLRLTFVEFYKNAGFEGGGKPYNPFIKQSD